MSAAPAMTQREEELAAKLSTLVAALKHHDSLVTDVFGVSGLRDARKALERAMDDADEVREP